MKQRAIVCGLVLVFVLSQLGSVPLAGATEGQIPWVYLTNYQVASVAISLDGSYIVAGSDAGKIYFFSKSNNTPLWEYETGRPVRSVSISSDGGLIAVASDKVYLFSKESNVPLWSADVGGVLSVSISSMENYIAASTWDNMVYLFSTTSNNPLWSYSTDGRIWSVSASSDGSYIGAGSMRSSYPWGMVYLFNRTSSTPLWAASTDNPVNSVVVSSGGDYVAVGGSFGDGEIYLFSRTSSNPLWSYQTGDPVNQVSVQSVAISSDGSYVVAGTSDNKVYFFSRDSNTPIWSYDADSRVWSVSISSDGKYIVAGSSRSVYLFSRDSSAPLWSCKFGSSVNPVAVSPDGNYVVAGGPAYPAWIGGKYYYGIHLFSREAQFYAILTFVTPDIRPLANTGIHYGFSSDNVTLLLGTTESHGVITSGNFELGGRMVYFRTSDGEYAGSAFINPTGGVEEVMLGEVVEPPLGPSSAIPWAAIVIVLVVGGVVGAIFVRKR